MAGISLAQISGKPRAFSELFPHATDLHQRIQTTLGTGHSFTIREDELVNRMGEPWVVEIHIQPMHDMKGILSGAILVLRDLSSFKKMEEEILHNDRLAIMGTIASGLAHEIKNPLWGIKGAAQMLTRELKKNDLTEYLEIIIKESDRVNELISELLTFASPQKIRLASVNVNKLLDEVVRLEQQAEGPQIVFHRHYDPSLPNVKGDENQLKQAFLNFIKNGREAISKKGTISVTTRMVTEYQLKTEKGRAARMVAVDIEDSGCGMDEETLAHLFAPFYTTKKKGTGLGLAISHRIISEHQGFIQVDSTPKKGSTVRIFLRASH
jgi:two-component system nitrogen regulation sensor histidine kinase GlnL